MPLTLDDIQQGLAEDQDLKGQLLDALSEDATGVLKNKGFIIRSQDEESKFLRKYEDEKIDPRTEELYNRMDNDIFEASGMPRDKTRHKKTWEYAKDVIGTLKAQISDLQNSRSDDMSKQRIAALETELQEAKGQSESLKKEYATEKLNLRLANSFSVAFNDLKINVPEGVSEQEAEAYRSNKRAMLQSALLSQYTPVEQDGKLVYQDKEGKVAMTGGNYATEKDLLTANFKYEFESEQRRKGTGQQGGGYQGGGLPNITDKKGVYDQANKEGLTTGSKAWTERVVEIAKQKNIPLEG